jgi:hypothetical protein
MALRVTKPGRILSGPQTVAVPARNTGTSWPAARGGIPTVPLKVQAPHAQTVTVQRQGFTQPIKRNGYSR